MALAKTSTQVFACALNMHPYVVTCEASQLTYVSYKNYVTFAGQRVVQVMHSSAVNTWWGVTAASCCYFVFLINSTALHFYFTNQTTNLLWKSFLVFFSYFGRLVIISNLHLFYGERRLPHFELSWILLRLSLQTALIISLLYNFTNWVNYFDLLSLLSTGLCFLMN